ncbi:MAG: DUF4123 domain-containing protein [Deltaproteobacteria bacterium]|nr:DUF4123 domain-containing protein [Deltaproteobacteria bacterium]MBK8239853.1 DUF4123 domain-containing protein [Deltaproteobacteria bacterium]MBK8716169.1 DUF4123 domain-containing protein [Deltaproteobacteria bacterium]
MSQNKRTINGIIRRALADARSSAPPARVYALVDPARDDRIAAELASPGQRSICLYGVDLPGTLVAVAPHLVWLSGNSRFGQLFASQGRGRAWGMLLASHAPAETIATHLASLTRARLPDGRTVLFRFYDPRVMRRYLPTCTPDELDRVFGPIEAFLIEEPGGAQQEYAREDRTLQRRDPRWELWLD